MAERVRISPEAIEAALEPFKRRVYETYIVDEDGVVRKPDGKGVHWLEPQ